MAIDGIKSSPASIPTQPAQVETTPQVAPLPPPPPPKLEPTQVTDFSDAKAKPLSITGKFSPPPIAFTPRDDLASFVANARTLSSVSGANLAPSSSLVAASSSDGDLSTKEKLQAAIADNDDDTLRKIINHDPSTLKNLDAKEKGQALKVASEGFRSEHDAYLMENIVNSCTSKQELREVVASARGHSDVSKLSQADYHHFDREMADEGIHDYLIANKLNPANTELPETASASAPAKTATLEESAALMKTADTQMKSGDYAGARKTLQALKEMPTPEGQVDVLSTKGGKNGVDVTLKPAKPINNGQIAAVKLAQVELSEKMSKVAGTPFDATNTKDVKRYFDTISKDPKVKTADIQSEFAMYTHNFYTPADKVDWGPNSPAIGDRNKPEKFNGMLENTELDRASRRALDCEGHSYLTGAVFGGNPRFDVTYASDSAHISAIVSEKKNPSSGFSVNTNYDVTISALNQNVRTNAKTPLGKREELAMLHHGKTATRGTTNLKAPGLSASDKLEKVNQPSKKPD